MFFEEYDGPVLFGEKLPPLKKTVHGVTSLHFRKCIMKVHESTRM